MSTPVTNECLHCHGGLAPGDARCTVCGTLRGETAPPPRTPDSSAPAAENRGLIDNPYAVLAAVFLAMAVLGIPLIWMCRAWSPATKVLLTIVTLIYTGLLFWGFWLIMAWVADRLKDSW
jgi:hypothetical protein